VDDREGMSSRTWANNIVLTGARRKIALAGLLASVVSCSLIVGCTSSEPRHDGRTLTEWLNEVNSPPISWAGPETNHPLDVAIRAVREIGTNGVPTLLRLMRALDSEQAKYLNEYGLVGFQVLGTNAQIAIPALLNDMESGDPSLRRRASVALEMVRYRGLHGPPAR
jgi:hypothetical protein